MSNPTETWTSVRSPADEGVKQNGWYLRHQSSVAVCAAIAGMLYFTFSDLIGIRFTNPDDIEFSLLRFKPYWEAAFTLAAQQGRFFHLYTTIFFKYPYYVWTDPIFDFLLFGPIISIPFLILYALRKTAKSITVGLLFVILYFAFVPATYRFNLLFSYPTRHTFGILLFLASLLWINRYFESRRLRDLLVSNALLFISFLHSEALAVQFSAVMWLIIAAKSGPKFTARYFFSRPNVGLYTVVFVYGALFVAWRLLHPSQYIGNQILTIGTESVGNYLDTFVYFSKASLPLYHFVSHYPLVYIDGGSGLYAAASVPNGIADVIEGLSLSNFLRSLCITATFLLISHHEELPVRRKVLVYVGLIGTVLYVIPSAIFAAIPSYQTYVSGGYAPLHMTFFSYYGAILAISCAAAYMISWAAGNGKIVHRVLLLPTAMLLFLTASMSGHFNEQVARHMHDNTARWNAMNLFMSFVEEHNIRTVRFSAPQLWASVPVPKNYWTQLMQLTTGREIALEREIPVGGNDSTKSTGELRFACPERRNCHVWFGQRVPAVPGGNATVDSVTILSTVDRPLFVSYRTGGSEIVKAVRLKRQRSRGLAVYEGTVRDDPIDFDSFRFR